jgi:hypothetical protein
MSDIPTARRCKSYRDCARQLPVAKSKVGGRYIGLMQIGADFVAMSVKNP